jgi:hypothetical protein
MNPAVTLLQSRRYGVGWVLSVNGGMLMATLLKYVEPVTGHPHWRASGTLFVDYGVREAAPGVMLRVTLSKVS